MTQVTISTDAQRTYRNRLVLTTALCGTLLIAAPAYGQVASSAFNGDYVGFGKISSTYSSAAGTGITSVSSSGTNLNIGANASAVINWDNLSIQNGTTATFTNTRADQTPINILNRVASTGGATTINGNLDSGSNVGVYIVNPNGVIFGNNARVNVGSLIASTLDVTDSDFLDGGSLRFSQGANPSGTITVQSGAQLTALTDAAGGAAGLGRLFLLGAMVDSAGTLTANTGAGEVAMAVASDVIATLGNGPIDLKIQSGSAMDVGMKVRGTISGRNVTLVVATKAGLTNALLDVGALITANTVEATDKGIRLLGGMDSADGRVKMEYAAGNRSANYGKNVIRIRENSALTASGSGGNIEARALGYFDFYNNSNVQWDGSASNNWTVNFRGQADITLQATNHVIPVPLGQNPILDLRPIAFGSTVNGGRPTRITLLSESNGLRLNNLNADSITLQGQGPGGTAFNDITANDLAISGGPLTGNDINIQGSGAVIVASGISLNKITGPSAFLNLYAGTGDIWIKGDVSGNKVSIAADGARNSLRLDGNISSNSELYIRSGKIYLGDDADSETLKAYEIKIYAPEKFEQVGGVDTPIVGTGVIVGGFGLNLRAGAPTASGTIKILGANRINFDPSTDIRGYVNASGVELFPTTLTIYSKSTADINFGNIDATWMRFSSDATLTSSEPSAERTSTPGNPNPFFPSSTTVRAGAMRFGNLTLDEGVSMTSTAGAMSLGTVQIGSGAFTAVADQGLTLNGNVSGPGAITLGGGQLALSGAARDVTSSSGAVALTGNGVSVNLVRGTSVTADGAAGGTTLGNVTATAGNIDLGSDSGTKGVVTTGTLTANSGSIDADGTSLTLGTVSARDGITLDSTAGAIQLPSATTTNGTLAIKAAGGAVTIGATSGDALKTSGAIDVAGTGGVTIGSAGARGDVSGSKVSIKGTGANAAVTIGKVTATGAAVSTPGDATLVLSATGALTAGDVTASTGNMLLSGGTVGANALSARAGIGVTSGGAVNLASVQNIAQGVTPASGNILIDAGGAITATGLIDNKADRVILRAGGLIDVKTISASGAIVGGNDGTGDNEATIDIRSTGGGLNAVALTATTGDIDIDTSGPVTVTNNITVPGDITIATTGLVQLQQVISTGGLIDIGGNGLTIAQVQANGAAGSVRLAGGTGALTLNDLVQGAGNVNLSGASIGKGGASTAGVVTSSAGSVTATAGGGLTLTSVSAATNIDLTATNGTVDITAASGNVLNAGGVVTVKAQGSSGVRNIVIGSGSGGNGAIQAGEVSLDAAGNVQVGTVTATAAADADPNAATIDINAAGTVTTGALTAASGDIEVDGVGVTLGKVTGNGGTVDLDAKTGALRLNDSVTGLGTVTLAGASIAKGPTPTANAGNITSTGGGIRATVTTGNITLGNLDAEQVVDIDDLDAASGSDFTIGNITARGAAGDLSNATVDIDTKGYVQTGSITALNGTIDIDSGKANGGNSLYTLGLRAGRGISLASTAAGRVYLDSAESVAGGIDIVSGGDVLVGSNVVGGTLINRGSGNISVTAKGAGTIKTFGLIQNDGGLVTLAAPGAITVAGDITAGGAVDPAANAGTITIKGATVSAGNVLAQQGGVPTGDIYIRATTADANGNGIAVKSLKAGGSVDASTTAGGIYIGDTATSTPGNVTSTNDFVHLTAPGRIIAADVTAGGAVDAALNAGTITLASSGSYVAVGDVRAVNGSGTPTGDIYIRSAGTGGESSWDNGIIAKSLTAGGGIVAEATVVGGIYIGTNPGNPNSSTAGNVNNGTGEARLSALGTSGNIVAKDIFSDGTIDLGNGNGAIKVGILDGDQGVLASAGLEVTIQSAISSAGFIDVGSSSRAVTVENSAGAQYAMNGYQGISLVGGSIEVKQGGINSAAGTVTVEATSGNVNVKDVSAAINASLTATGNVTAGNVRADGVVPSINATVTISADDTIQTGNITANNGDIYLSSVGQAGTDSIKTGALTGAAGIVAQAVNGNIHITSAETEAGGTISLIAGLGNLTVDGLVDSGSDVTLYAWDTVDLQGAVTAVGDVTVTGGANLFDSTGQAVKFTSISGRDVTVEANNGTIKGATLTATREATVNSYETDIDSTSRILVDIGSVNGAKTSVTSSNGDIALGSVTANYAVVTSADGNLDIGTVSQTGNYGINSGVELTGANVDVDAITQSTRAEITATAGNINFGSISGSDITLTAGSGSVLGMAGTGGDITQSGIYNGRARVTVTGGTVNIDDIGFTGSSVEITSTAGDVTVGDITGAAGSGLVTVKSSDANSIAIGDVNVGDITAGGKLSLTGLSVTAGDLSGDSMEVTAESGSVTAGKTKSLGGNSTTSIIASENITLNGDANAAFRIIANAGGDITFGTISARDVQVTAGDEVSGQTVTASDQAYIWGTNKVGLTSTGGGRIALESNAAIQVGNFSGARLSAVAHGGTIDLTSVTQTGSVRLGGQTYSGVYIHNEADMSAPANAAYVRIGTLNADNTTTIIGPRITATGGNWTVWDSRPGAPTQPTLHLSALDTVSLRDVKAGTISLDSVVTDANDPDTQYNNYTAMYNQAAGTAIEADLVTGQAASIDWSQDNRIGRIANLLTYSNLTINDTTGGISLGGAINAVGGDIDIRTRGGNLAIEAGATVRGRLVALSTQGANGTAGYFLNNAGASAVQASDHWAIYADYYQNPGDFGGLDSNNTAIWSKTIGSLAPDDVVGGNRYVFSHTPTVVITANLTKTYGDVLNLATAAYNVSGIEAGVANAFLGDTRETVLPAVINMYAAGGTAVRDNVGTYAITMDPVTANLGYAAQAQGGTLTVTRRAVTATITAQDKTYDGSDTTTGSYAFDNLVAPDDFAGSRALYRFLAQGTLPGQRAKDAGDNKAVEIANYGLSSPYLSNYDITFVEDRTASIFKKNINVTISAHNREYDGTTNAEVDINFDGKVGTDILGVGGTFTFSDKNAGVHNVTFSGSPVLTGDDAGNYNVDSSTVSATAEIYKRRVSVTANVTDKIYDGTTKGTGTFNTINTGVTNETISVTDGSFTFGGKDVGSYDVTVGAQYACSSGCDLNNYDIVIDGNYRASITPKHITANATAGTTKVYDGTTAVKGLVLGTLNDLVSGDAGNVYVTGGTYTYDSKDAGNRTINASRIQLAGAAAGNYVVDDFSLAGAISQADIHVSAYANDRDYDRTTGATGGLSSISGIVGSDIGKVGVTASYAFRDANAGQNKNVDVTLGLTGSEAGNYRVVLDNSVTATIRQKAVRVTATAASKEYDQSASTTGSALINLADILSGDTVGFQTAGIYTFVDASGNADANAGQGKRVVVSGLQLDNANYRIDGPVFTTANIDPRHIGLNVVGGTTKTYDRLTQAFLQYGGLSGVLSGDDVSLASANANYRDRNASDNVAIDVTNVQLAGGQARNYVVDDFALMGAIQKRALQVQIAADSKDYNKSTEAQGRVTRVDNVVSGDVVNVTFGSYQFDNANAGTNKTVTASNASVSNSNYEIRGPVTTLAEIRKKVVSVTIAASNKTYDGNTSAQGTITGVQGVIDGDMVGATGGTYVFSDKNAANGKTVTGSGFQLTGGDAGNYQVAGPATTLADILKKVVNASVTVNSKVYDGNNVGTGQITVSGIVAGDVANVVGGTYTFSDANAGTGKQVTVGGASLAGRDAQNYTLVVPTMAFADIMKRAITVRANDLFKVVDKADPELTYRVTNGSLVAGDSFTGALSRTPGEALGTYAIGQGTLALSSNYALTFQGGTFRIGQEGDDPGIPTNVNGGLNNDIQQTVEMGNGSGLQDRRPPLVWEGYIDCTSDDLRDREGCKIDSSHLDGFVEASVELGIEAPAV